MEFFFYLLLNKVKAALPKYSLDRAWGIFQDGFSTQLRKSVTSLSMEDVEEMEITLNQRMSVKLNAFLLKRVSKGNS